MIAHRSEFVDAHDVVERSLDATLVGPHTLRLRFGTASVDVRGLDPMRHAAASKRFHALCSEANATIAVEVVDAIDGFRVIDTRGWENTFALEHHADNVVMVGRDFCSRIGLDRETHAPLSAKVACTRHDNEFLAPLENTLRVIAAYRCLSNGGALFHAASIVDDDAVRVCFAASGTGKSTMAGNWLRRGRVVLGDELCAVEFDSETNAFVVEQLPFAGDLEVEPQPAKRFRLASLHRLAQGPLALSPLPKSQAIASMAACSPFVNVDALRASVLLDNLAKLARTHAPTTLSLGIDDDPRALWSAKFRLASDVRFRVVDGEAVVIRQERGEVLGLNGTGSTAFQLAASGHDLDSIVDSIAHDHDAERDVVAADVRAFFDSLVTDGLLVRA